MRTCDKNSLFTHRECMCVCYNVGGGKGLVLTGTVCWGAGGGLMFSQWKCKKMIQ